MEKSPRITLDPHIHGHRPSVRGLRIRLACAARQIRRPIPQVA